jgi:hypothetical protein
MFLAELNGLLAPLGINALGASIVLLFLNDVFSKSKKTVGKKGQRGGSFVSGVSGTLAPAGVEMFTVTAILLILSKIFDGVKKGAAKKGQRGGSMIAGLVNELNQLLMPFGATTFATTLSLLAIYKLYENSRMSVKGLIPSGLMMKKKRTVRRKKTTKTTKAKKQ